MKQVILGLVVCVCFYSCNEHHEKKEEHGTHHVTSPIRIDTVSTKNYVSQIHAIRNIEIRALEKGYLSSIYIDEGESVKKGQKLFQIKASLYKAELKKAEAEAHAMEIEYKNTKLLADSNIVSPNQLALAKAHYEKAYAEVVMAKTHLGFTTLTAPFDGIIDHFHVREGSLLDEGDLLTSMSDVSKMWVYFNVPEAEYLDYVTSSKRGEKTEVELLLANNKKFEHKGIVETIEGEFNNETGNIAFRATFPNPDKILRHGETGSVIVKIPLKNVLIIPQKATFEVLDKKYVFVIDENNIAHQREVTVGAELPHLFEIKEGLTSKDKVLLDGIRLVNDGSEVSYDFIPPKKVISNLELYAE